jgi:threonine aldolase
MARSFGSDNNSGIHPAIMDALVKANTGHAIGYGDDEITKLAEDKFRQLFGCELDVYFVFSGTAANILSLATLCQPFHSIICAETSHIHVDECGAPERFIGCKIIPVKTKNGKLTVEIVEPYLTGFGTEHHSQPRIISIAQASELGTVYRPIEIKALSDLAHKHSMYLHIDGARIANAVASLGCSISDISKFSGADILTFGGTKNGMMFGEAIIFFDKTLSKKFKFIRKQGMQLYSKMRFVSAQFVAYLENGLWLQNARNANKMANLLADEIKKIPQINITQVTESNGVFAKIPKRIIEPLREQFFFYNWDEANDEVRWMCSFDTSEKDVIDFVSVIKKLL